MIRSHVPAVLLTCLLVATTPGCKLFGGKEAEAGKETSESPGEPTYKRFPLGEITFINADEGFVLIRAYGASRLPEGSLLEGRNAVTGQVTSLELSPERKRSFLVGDITAGQPAMGDRVDLLIEVVEAGPVPIDW
jgi:hypothetical protein